MRALLDYKKPQEQKIISRHVPDIFAVELFRSLKEKAIRIKSYVTGEPMEAREEVEPRRRYRNSMSVRNKYNEREKRKKRSLGEKFKMTYRIYDLFKFVYTLGTTLLLQKIIPPLFTNVFLVSKNKCDPNVSLVRM